MTIEELATLLQVGIRVTYIDDWSANKHRRDPYSERWVAYLERTEIADGAVLVDSAAWGASPEAAISGLCQELRGKILVVDAGRPERKEFRAPATIERGAL